MRSKFRCVCCGGKISKYSSDMRADAGYLCTVCARAYCMGLEDAIKGKREEVGKKVREEMVNLRDRLIRYQDEVAFLTKFLYCSDENFKEKWDERLKGRGSN